MARFKKFEAGKKITDFESLGFELNGHDFECYPAIQGAVFLDFISISEKEDGAAASALYGFLKDSMPKKEYDRLQEVLHDPEVIIEIETIAEIVKYLVEEYASRPTQEPNS